MLDWFWGEGMKNVGFFVQNRLFLLRMVWNIKNNCTNPKYFGWTFFVKKNTKVVQNWNYFSWGSSDRWKDVFWQASPWLGKTLRETKKKKVQSHTNAQHILPWEIWGVSAWRQWMRIDQNLKSPAGGNGTTKTKEVKHKICLCNAKKLNFWKDPNLLLWDSYSCIKRSSDALFSSTMCEYSGSFMQALIWLDHRKANRVAHRSTKDPPRPSTIFSLSFFSRSSRFECEQLQKIQCSGLLKDCFAGAENLRVE